MSDRLLHILLVEDNPGDALLVQEMIFDADAEAFTLQQAGSLLEGLDKLAQRDADVILLDLNLPDSQGLETFTAMQAHAPHTPIVLLTGNDDDTLALAAVEAGAEDYLVKDRLGAEALIRALRYAVVRHQSRNGHGDRPEDGARGRIIGVLGSKGGVGTTTVACHLAADIRRQTEAAVLLADLDFDSGAVGFLMQVSSSYTFLDAAANVHRLDAEFWRGMVSKTAAGVDVMPSPELAGDGEWPAHGRVRHTLRFARTQYDWVVVDAGCLNPLSAKVLPEMDQLVLVTTSELIAVHHAARVLDELDKLGIDHDEVALVHNQTNKRSGGPDVLKAVVKMPIRAALPSCEGELRAAYTKGKLLESGEGFGRQVAALAAAVAGVEPKPQESTGFSLRRLTLFGAKAEETAQRAGK